MNKLEVNTSTGIISGWKCSGCGLYNDILSFYCGMQANDYPGRCIGHRDFDLGLASSLIAINRRGESIYMSLSEKEQKELHTEFFNKGLSMAVSTATIEELDTKLDSLARIAYEAKCLVQGVAEGKRQRVAKLSKEERDKLITKPDLTTSDAFQSVKKRADRMSQADKLVQTYRNMGMDDETIQEMLGKIKIKESQQSVLAASSQSLVEHRITEKSAPENGKANQTQEALLGDISRSLVDGLKNGDRPIDDLVKAANTAGHIANRILGPLTELELHKEAMAEIKDIVAHTMEESSLVEAKQELVEITQPESKPEVPSFLKGLFGN
jgi:hypothetical protein